MTCRNGVCRHDSSAISKLEGMLQSGKAKIEKAKEYLAVTAHKQLNPSLWAALSGIQGIRAIESFSQGDNKEGLMRLGLAVGNSLIAYIVSKPAQRHFEKYERKKRFLEQEGWKDGYAKKDLRSDSSRLALHQAARETGYQLQAERVLGEQGYDKTPSKLKEIF